jgi:hypothetical protein
MSVESAKDTTKGKFHGIEAYLRKRREFLTVNGIPKKSIEENIVFVRSDMHKARQSLPWIKE